MLLIVPPTRRGRVVTPRQQAYRAATPSRLTFAAVVLAAAAAARADLGVNRATQDWAHAGGQQDGRGAARSRSAGQPFARGFSTHAASAWTTRAKGNPDGLGPVVTFAFVGHGRTLFTSGPVRFGDAVKPVDVDLHGVPHVGADRDAGGRDHVLPRRLARDPGVTYDGGRADAGGGACGAGREAHGRRRRRRRGSTPPLRSASGPGTRSWTRSRFVSAEGPERPRRISCPTWRSPRHGCLLLKVTAR